MVTLLAFIFAYGKNPDHLEYAQTVAFATLVLAQFIHVFDCRSEKSILSRNPFGNKYLVGQSCYHSYGISGHLLSAIATDFPYEAFPSGRIG